MFETLIGCWVMIKSIVELIDRLAILAQCMLCPTLKNVALKFVTVRSDPDALSFRPKNENPKEILFQLTIITTN